MRVQIADHPQATQCNISAFSIPSGFTEWRTLTAGPFIVAIIAYGKTILPKKIGNYYHADY